MQNITFQNIDTIGNLVFENELYKHYHYPKMLVRYDSNFLEFNMPPSVEGFKEAADYLRQYHLKHGQNHVKFYFPENTKPGKDLMNYFGENEYEVGYSELFAIKPTHFPEVRQLLDIEIHAVTDTNFEMYLDFQYKTDLEFGEDFATQKIDLHKQNFQDDKILQVLAFYKEIPAGSVDVIITDETAEIDGLTVDEEFQKKGIGTRLQKYVMDQFPNKTVILVADGEDTPREMYLKQNYQYLGFKYEVFKVYDAVNG